MDAWGTMSIPGGTYDVLREKRTLDQDVRLDAKVGFLGWQDITDIVLGLTDIGADVLGNNQVVRYYFWNDVAKETHSCSDYEFGGCKLCDCGRFQS